MPYGARFEERYPELAEAERPMIRRIERIRFLRSDAQLLRLRGADLRELMVTRPPIVQGIVRVLVRRLRDAGQRRASHA